MQPRSSAIRRTALLIILIELILLAVFAFQAIRFGTANDRSEAAAREELLQNSAEQLHTVLNAAIRMAENLASDDRMNQLAYHSYLSEYDRSRIILGLITNLKNMQGMYPVVDNIQILFPKEEMVLDNNSGYNNQRPYESPSEEELHLSPFMYYEDGVLKLRIQYPLITAYFENIKDAFTGIHGPVEFRNWQEAIEQLNDLSRQATDRSEQARGQQEERLVTRIKRYIDSHLKDGPSLTDIADHYHFSREYLLRVFKKEEGVTILSYINDLKLDKAKARLTGTSMQVREIAEDLGFSSTAYFIRFFRTKTGMSPQAWRDQHSKI